MTVLSVHLVFSLDRLSVTALSIHLVLSLGRLSVLVTVLSVYLVLSLGLLTLIALMFYINKLAVVCNGQCLVVWPVSHVQSHHIAIF